MYMEIKLKFSKPLDLLTDLISLDDYEMCINGENIILNFEFFGYHVDRKDKTILHWSGNEIDSKLTRYRNETSGNIQLQKKLVEAEELNVSEISGMYCDVERVTKKENFARSCRVSKEGIRYRTKKKNKNKKNRINLVGIVGLKLGNDKTQTNVDKAVLDTALGMDAKVKR